MIAPGSKKDPKRGGFIVGNGLLFSRSLPGGSQVPPGYHFGPFLAPFWKVFWYSFLACSPWRACPRRRQAQQILCQKIGESCLPPEHASPKIGDSCSPPPPRQISQNCSWAWTNDKQSGPEFATATPPLQTPWRANSAVSKGSGGVTPHGVFDKGGTTLGIPPFPSKITSRGTFLAPLGHPGRPCQIQTPKRSKKSFSKRPKCVQTA